MVLLIRETFKSSRRILTDLSVSLWDVPGNIHSKTGGTNDRQGQLFISPIRIFAESPIDAGPVDLSLP
jgi:hypothetical protein